MSPCLLTSLLPLPPQPLSSSLLTWNATHFLLLPFLRLVLSMAAVDGAFLAPLSCAISNTVGSLDYAARASRVLLRVSGWVHVGQPVVPGKGRQAGAAAGGLVW